MLTALGLPPGLALIAGPCVIESEEHVHFLAREIGKSVGAFIFKASFDKANRSSVTAYRGPGLKEGLRILKTVHDAGRIFELGTVYRPGERRAPLDAGKRHA